MVVCHFPYRGDSQPRDRYVDHRPIDKGDWLLHGHVHDRWGQHGRMINVGVDATDFRPIDSETIEGIIRRARGAVHSSRTVSTMASNDDVAGDQAMVVAGQRIDVDSASVIATARAHDPEVIQRHWVDVEGIRFPPKQLFQLCTGVPRSVFISHQALRVFQRLGFTTSEISNSTSPAQTEQSISVVRGTGPYGPTRESVQDAVDALFDFMHQSSLTGRIAQLEHELVGATDTDVAQLAGTHAISDDMLAAALTIRSAFGRVNDVIHAAVIALSLPHVLEPGEQITNRPSLAAGNDPSRPFDLETDRRVAEFKVSVWTGKDAMRKRGVFADLIHLALDETGRRQQLFVVGKPTEALSRDHHLGRGVGVEPKLPVPSRPLQRALRIPGRPDCRGTCDSREQRRDRRPRRRDTRHRSNARRRLERRRLTRRAVNPRAACIVMLDRRMTDISLVSAGERKVGPST